MTNWKMYCQSRIKKTPHELEKFLYVCGVILFTQQLIFLLFIFYLIIIQASKHSTILILRLWDFRYIKSVFSSPSMYVLFIKYRCKYRCILNAHSMSISLASKILLPSSRLLYYLKMSNSFLHWVNPLSNVIRDSYWEIYSVEI